MLNFLEERNSHTSLQRAKEGRGSGCDLNVSEGQRHFFLSHFKKKKSRFLLMLKNVKMLYSTDFYGIFEVHHLVF